MKKKLQLFDCLNGHASWFPTYLLCNFDVLITINYKLCSCLFIFSYSTIQRNISRKTKNMYIYHMLFIFCWIPASDNKFYILTNYLGNYNTFDQSLPSWMTVSCWSFLLETFLINIKDFCKLTDIGKIKIINIWHIWTILFQ